MDDSFTFGTRARRSAVAKRRPRARRAAAGSVRAGTGRAGTGRVVWLVVGGIAAVVSIAGVMSLVKSGGEQVAASEHSAVSQIGTADDVQAKTTAAQAVGAVQQLFAEQGSFDGITAAALKRFEPAFAYTGGASSGPNVVSVTSSADGVGLAVLSGSGTCFTAYVSATGTAGGPTQGACTGAAAVSRSA